MQHSPIFALALAVGIALSSVGAAYAGSDGEVDQQKEIDAVLGAKISLSQAIVAAEAATGGKAFAADIAGKTGALGYEVKTAKEGVLQMVTVDPTLGKVIAVTPIDIKSDDEEQAD